VVLESCASRGTEGPSTCPPDYLLRGQPALYHWASSDYYSTVRSTSLRTTKKLWCMKRLLVAKTDVEMLSQLHPDSRMSTEQLLSYCSGQPTSIYPLFHFHSECGGLCFRECFPQWWGKPSYLTKVRPAAGCGRSTRMGRADLVLIWLAWPFLILSCCRVRVLRKRY
jgi:hypothetical protein